MIRTIAAALAAFALISFGARAEEAKAAEKTEAKTEKAADKKAEKAEKKAEKAEKKAEKAEEKK
jgi:hypothetical protein